MSIQKKSLISALKTTKKANVASTEGVKGEKKASMGGAKTFRTGGLKTVRTGGLKIPHNA
jgi:hypothetical protein